MKTRNVYLDNMPLEEALGIYEEKLRAAGAWRQLPGEFIPVDEARGRVTAEAVFARISSPHYHASAMDGFAVRAKDTFGASETNPLRLKVKEKAFPVDTGDPLPEGCDAVIMIENVAPVGDEIEIIAAAAPWQHIRAIGEDLVATEMIVPANHRLGPYDLGALLAGGITQVAVRRWPKVVVIPTGTELVQPGSELKPGDIVEYNSRVLGGLAEEWGAKVKRYDIVADDYDRIKKTLLAALAEADLVMINAGSSAGSEDFTSAIISELGEVVCHGVAIKPAKPTILGIAQGKPVIGVPGYPVSAALACELFVKPVLGAMQGLVLLARHTMAALLSRKVMSPPGGEEFMRVKLGRVGGEVIATPMSRGAGLITSLVRADGLVRIPRLVEGIEAGQEVEVELFRHSQEIANTTMVIGSHDITLDILANRLRLKHPERSMASAHVGSLGGLMALRRGEAHLAGIHLLDEATGEYNVPYLNRMLGNRPVVLVNLVLREQGLLVPKGNPKGIGGITDLVGKGIKYINRQRGAGTRLLLDYQLGQLGLSQEEIEGYDREEFTHMAVAAAVASGSADTGLGIYAAAQALGLDFIPVAQERYDLAIPGEFWDTPHIRDVLAILADDDFKQEVLALGGYDVSRMGEVIFSS
ncbi:MAG: molybdopterin biosynthesis protein [Clostridia bacterium]|nr:molybdopterin biosynthesis protein [Clostridia bacterium]